MRAIESYISERVNDRLIIAISVNTKDRMSQVKEHLKNTLLEDVMIIEASTIVDGPICYGIRNVDKKRRTKKTIVILYLNTEYENLFRALMLINLGLTYERIHLLYDRKDHKEERKTSKKWSRRLSEYLEECYIKIHREYI
jgi:hypothetical protein